jgi:TonB-linked SusC/RagA family outer membrane protein
MIRFYLVGVLFCCSVLTIEAQRLSGKVISAVNQEELPGVNVIIKGTSQGSVTDITGVFTVDVASGSTLVFSFVGFKTQELIYTGQANVTVIMEEAANELNEIVVVGYSSISKRDITGAISTVNADDLKNISVNGLDQALQGQVAGVQVTQSSGTPGGGVTVRIRGATSIGAVNTPLYIIDGIPVETGSLSSRNFGGQNDNALALLNPNDIETYTVLADASAKAIYGSRASNGVIVITTKRGKNTKTQISFDIQRGIVDAVKTLDLMNASQLLDLQRETVTNADQNPDGFGLIKGVTDGINTNWQDEVLRTGIMQQYQLSATGGDDNTNFYISGSFREEEGVQLNNSFQRLGTTINLDQKLTDKLSVATNLSLSYSLNKRVKGDNFLDGVYSGAVKSLPFYTPYNEQGQLVGPASALYAGFPNFNPVAQALLPRFNTSTVKTLMSISGTYKINSELSFKAQASLDYNDVKEDQYESSQTAIGGFLPSVGGQGYGIFSASNFTNTVYYGTFSYIKNSLTNISLIQQLALNYIKIIQVVVVYRVAYTLVMTSRTLIQQVLLMRVARTKNPRIPSCHFLERPDMIMMIGF